MGGAAGIQEGGSAVFEQFRDGQQRSGVLVGIRHRALQTENVGQILGAQVIGKQPARGVGVAYVHMAVDETGRHDHAAAIDDRIGGHVGQFGRLAHLGDAAAGNHHGAVGDDAPLRVHADDVANAVDFQGGFRHGNFPARHSGP